MTEYEATTKLQSLIKQINAVKTQYDNQYMFSSSMFFRNYMSQHLYPLMEQVSPLFQYILEDTLEHLMVEDIWTGEKNIEFPMWMYFFNNWTHLTR